MRLTFWRSNVSRMDECEEIRGILIKLKEHFILQILFAGLCLGKKQPETFSNSFLVNLESKR